MASTDALPVPRKNAAYRITFPILDADGDLVTGATGLDSEVSKDAGTFADCTNEATEIATASGVYYLDLTSTEMNADTVALIVKTTSSGAKTTVLVLYPEEAGDYRADVTHWLGTAAQGASGRPQVDVELIEGADPSDTIRDAVVDDATRIDASALNTLSSHDPGETIMGATDLGTGAGLTSLASAANLATVAGYLDTEVAAILAAVDTEVAAIKAKTDSLTFTVAGHLDANVLLWRGTAPLALTNQRVRVDLEADGLRTDAVTEIVDAVWAAATRTLTALDEDSTTLDLDATIRAALGLASANLDTQLADLPTNAELATALGTADDAVLSALATVDSNVDAIKAQTDELTFTVPGVLDANVEAVNGTEVTGSGTEPDPWGP